MFASPALLALNGVTSKDLSLECTLLLKLVGNRVPYFFFFVYFLLKCN